MSKDAHSAGTDLGRRLLGSAATLGLSVADPAERAAKAPGYLAYLESSSYRTPDPSQRLVAGHQLVAADCRSLPDGPA